MSNAPSGACAFTACPCNDNICQLRLDFVNFNIAGPATNTDVIANLIAGQQVQKNNGGIPAALSTRCLTDTFTVTNPGGPTPPVSRIMQRAPGQQLIFDFRRYADWILENIVSNLCFHTFQRVFLNKLISSLQCMLMCAETPIATT